jgi:uncharacterized protein (DUF2141 family)
LIFSLSAKLYHLRIGLLALGLLAAGCAEIAPPPGGEVDKTGPTLISSDPANGTLGVTSLQSITLTFSERLLKPAKSSGVFISPRLTFEPEIKWESEQITVLLAEPLKTNQTYVVSLNTDITDLRRNRLDSAITIAFSTGDYIDSGSAAGVIFTAEDKPAAGWAVGLFRDPGFPDIEQADSIYPDYLTHCDTKGSFALRYLPPGDYRLLAFDDRNSDDRFNLDVEAFAVPDRQFTIGGDLKLDNLILTGTEFDSLTPRITAAVATTDGLLRVRLSRSIDPTWLGHRAEELRLLSVADSSGYPAEAILEAAHDETSVLTAYLPDLPEGWYRLHLQYDASREPLVFDSVDFRRLEDKSPPTLISSKPETSTLFAHAVTIAHTYSEPLDTLQIADDTYSLWESDSLLVPTTLHWEDRFHLTVQSERMLPARRYRLDLREFDLVDLSGNRLGDSARSFSFATLDADSLGSISGAVLISDTSNQNASTHLTFELAGVGRTFDILVPSQTPSSDGTGRTFALNLPPGKYLLRGFVDRDDDGELTPGGIRPFRLSETRAIYTDTIAVRARFETAGIQFHID